MSRLTILLPIAVLLPLGAFVVGSLVASADDPPARPPIRISDAPASSDPPSPAPVSPQPGRVDDDPRDRDDDTRDDDGPGGDDDDDRDDTDERDDSEDEGDDEGDDDDDEN